MRQPPSAWLARPSLLPIETPDRLFIPLHEGDDVLIDDGSGQMRLTQISYRAPPDLPAVFGGTPGGEYMTVDGIPLRRGLRAAISVR